MDHVELHEGSRVALLLPGSTPYLDLVMSLLAAGVFPIPLDPRLTAYERERILAGLRPDLVVETPAQLDAMLRRTPERLRGACSAGPADARDQRHDRDAQGRRQRAADRAAGGGARGRGARPVGLPRRRREPGAQPAPPLRSPALRDGNAAGRRPSVVPGPFDPAAVTAAIDADRPTTMFCVPTHLQRLFAHWDEVGVPDLSLVPAGGPRRRAVPGGRQGAADRDVPARVDVGVLRLDRGPVHRLPQRGVAGASRHRRPGPARPLAVAGRGRHDLVRGARARAVRLLRRPREDRRGLADHDDGRGVHGRGPRPAWTTTATCSSTDGART